MKAFTPSPHAALLSKSGFIEIKDTGSSGVFFVAWSTGEVLHEVVDEELRQAIRIVRTFLEGYASRVRKQRLFLHFKGDISLTGAYDDGHVWVRVGHHSVRTFEKVPDYEAGTKH